MNYAISCLPDQHFMGKLKSPFHKWPNKQPFASVAKISANHQSPINCYSHVSASIISMPQIKEYILKRWFLSLFSSFHQGGKWYSIYILQVTHLLEYSNCYISRKKKWQFFSRSVCFNSHLPHLSHPSSCTVVLGKRKCSKMSTCQLPSR